MPETITSLIEKLEGAEVGSRELDERLWESIHDMPVAYPFDADQPCIPYGDSAMWIELPRYTTSLDAALALAKRVLPKDVSNGRPSHLTRLSERFNGTCEAALYRVTDGIAHESVADTPALALCAAILKAKEPTQ